MDLPWKFVTAAYAVAYCSLLFYGIGLYRRRARVLRELGQKKI